MRLARGGETILISDRDEVVAELGPARSSLPAPDSVDARFERLARAGQVSRAAVARPRRPFSPKALGLPKESVDRSLDELSEDR